MDTRLLSMSDTEARKHTTLRLVMLEIIDSLKFEIRERAYELLADPLASPFALDTAEDIVLWQLIEFLIQQQISRADTAVKSWQLTRDHAMHYWKVEICGASTRLVCED